MHEERPAMTLIRKEQIQITRLGIGYSNIIHSYFIKKQTAESYEYYDTNNAIEHLLFYYTKFEDTR